MLTSRYDEAFRYAHELHRTQTRKGTAIPYIAHLMTVSALVAEHGGSEEQAIGTLFHDAAEDQGGEATLNEIRVRFGDAVAEIVSDCTDSWDEPKPEWRPRKEAYLTKLPAKPTRSLLVSLADKTKSKACRKRKRNWRFVGLSAATIAWMYTTLCAAVASDCPRSKEIESRVGRMIVAGFFGKTTSDAGFRQILADLENGTVGGVLVLGRNISSRQDLQGIMKQIAFCKCARPPFIAIDEEGGAIDRLGPGVGAEETPSASDVARGSLASAHAIYARLAEKVVSFDFNVNLGPVVDLNRNPNNPVIGQLGRSYGSDVDTVVEHATAFIEEHRKRNIVTVLKHFPGHGSSPTDSHAEVADVTSTWSPDELSPFKRLIDAGLADAVMVGHLANSTKWGGVATQSGSNAISQILRKDLGFDGVVLTDDLAMKAVSDGASSTVAAAVDAVKAGADMVVVGRLGDDDQSADVGAEVNREITSKVCTGELDINAIEGSERRLQKLSEHWAPSPSK
jgi:beta-N-acetylhexosaminidase